MDVTSILHNLNAPQEQAVTSDKQHLLVLAGAGSGKTRVLVHRIAWKIQVDNVSPYGILAVTFTNKAAREMRERIDERIVSRVPRGKLCNWCPKTFVHWGGTMNLLRSVTTPRLLARRVKNGISSF